MCPPGSSVGTGLIRGSPAHPFLPLEPPGAPPPPTGSCAQPDICPHVIHLPLILSFSTRAWGHECLWHLSRMTLTSPPLQRAAWGIGGFSPGLPSWQEANTRAICRPFCCGVRGRGMGIRALPSPLRDRCGLPLRDSLLETAVLLLISVSSPLCSPASVSECLRPSLASWAACDSGPHFSSWNKA